MTFSPSPSIWKGINGEVLPYLPGSLVFPRKVACALTSHPTFLRKEPLWGVPLHVGLFELKFIPPLAEFYYIHVVGVILWSILQLPVRSRAFDWPDSLTKSRKELALLDRGFSRGLKRAIAAIDKTEVFNQTNSIPSRQGSLVRLAPSAEVLPDLSLGKRKGERVIQYLETLPFSPIHPRQVGTGGAGHSTSFRFQ